MKEIILTQNYTALIDDDDFKWLSKFSWHVQLQQRGTVVTAARASTITQDGIRGKCIYMHREILKCSSELQVDHINGNTLDNRKENLRLCTNAQNQSNQKIPFGKFKGVHKRKNGKFTARIRHNGLDINLGTYNTPIEAAQRHDAAAVYCYREFATINFPELKDEYLRQSEELDRMED